MLARHSAEERSRNAVAIAVPGHGGFALELHPPSTRRKRVYPDKCAAGVAPVRKPVGWMLQIPDGSGFFRHLRGGSAASGRGA